MVRCLVGADWGPRALELRSLRQVVSSLGTGASGQWEAETQSRSLIWG